MNILTSFLISIVAFFSGLFSHNVVPQISNVQQLTTIVATSTNDETLDWKIYNDTKLNYSIKYPTDLNMVFEPQNISAPSDVNPSFSLVNFKLDWNNFKALGGNEIMIKVENYDSSVCHGTIEDPEKQEVIIDGVKATKYIISGDGGGESIGAYAYIFQKTYNDRCFMITLNPYPADKDTVKKFDQIVSTFKFNKENNTLDVSTTTQKVILDTSSSTSTQDPSLIYKNEKYGFTITFPDSWKGYRAKDEDKSIDFGIKDQDLIFLVSVIPKQEWINMKDDEEKNGGPLPNYITENDKYVFTYFSAQDFTDSVFELARLRHEIMSTFTLLK